MRRANYVMIRFMLFYGTLYAYPIYKIKNMFIKIINNKTCEWETGLVKEEPQPQPNNPTNKQHEEQPKNTKKREQKILYIKYEKYEIKT